MVATLTIGLAHDTGTSASDNITSDATLTGTTDAGAAVAVYDLTGFILGSSPPVLLATVTADASGTWSYTPSVPDGPHAFMVEATDVAGNVRDSSPLFVTIDTASPTIRLFNDTGASASDHITANPILTGTAAPATVVTLMEGTTVLGTATADATGTWGFLSPTIGEGSHTITANTAGGSSSLTFTLDHSLVTPTIGLANDTGTSASDHITSDATLTGTTDAGAAVAVYDLTGFILGSSPPVLLAIVTADASGTWSYTPSVPDGPHAFMVEATDVAGNVRDSSPFYMTLDTAPPTIRLFDDTGASVSDHITANPILTGTAAPGTEVTLMEGTTVLGTATADATGTWGFFFSTIVDGSHTITANTAGGSSSLTFTLDHSLVTPTIGLANDTGTSASDHITSDATLTGTTDAGAAVAVYDLTGLITGSSPTPVLLATVTADASGTWSYTPSLPDGPHAFMAHATDVAGNVRDSSPFYMTLDTAPPTIRLFDDTGASASDHITANPILTGTAAPATVVTLMEGTTVLGTATADATGTWGFFLFHDCRRLAHHHGEHSRGLVVADLHARPLACDADDWAGQRHRYERQRPHHQRCHAHRHDRRRSCGRGLRSDRVYSRQQPAGLVGDRDGGCERHVELHPERA